MRTCVGCPERLDLAAQLSGTREQPGWHHVCCGVICPGCHATGHHPTYQPAGDGTAHPACACGWTGDTACLRLADVEAEWVKHYQAKTEDQQRESVRKP